MPVHWPHKIENKLRWSPHSAKEKGSGQYQLYCRANLLINLNFCFPLKLGHSELAPTSALSTVRQLLGTQLWMNLNSVSIWFTLVTILLEIEKNKNPSIFLTTYWNLSSKSVEFGSFFSMKNPLYRLKSYFSSWNLMKFHTKKKENTGHHWGPPMFWAHLAQPVYDHHWKKIITPNKLINQFHI